MSKLPVLKPKELIKKLSKLGFYKHRQKGSHLIMVHENMNKQVVIPVHNKELKRGTLAAILRQAGVKVGELN